VYTYVEIIQIYQTQNLATLILYLKDILTRKVGLKVSEDVRKVLGIYYKRPTPLKTF
jgi:hypothetical protein